MDAFFEHTYYNTYYYANIVKNILTGDIELIGFINNFFASEGTIYQLAEPFQKRSAFHLFAEHVVSEFFDNDMHEHDSLTYEHLKIDPHAKFIPYADKVLKEYGMNDSPFNYEVEDYADIEEYHSELYESGILMDLYAVIADEVFYVMFNNREALLQFNYIAAQHMNELDFSEIDDEEYIKAKKYFNRSGFLKRSRIPEWCKRAVYFRDRGRCCFCHQDLSGIVSISSKKHYDHIIPLVQGGLNDVANIQLLCSSCNNKKGDREIRTSNIYERWF